VFRSQHHCYYPIEIDNFKTHRSFAGASLLVEVRIRSRPTGALQTCASIRQSVFSHPSERLSSGASASLALPGQGRIRLTCGYRGICRRVHAGRMPLASKRRNQAPCLRTSLATERTVRRTGLIARSPGYSRNAQLEADHRLETPTHLPGCKTNTIRPPH
jgi:hypothetical protein